MADIRAIANGNWSNPAIWNTGVLPTSTSIVRPNNFTVTIDISVTVTEIRNDAGGGAVANGGFVTNDGVSVTATNGFFLAGTTTLLTYNGTTSIILNGQLNQILNLNVHCLNNTNTGLVTINGNLNQTGGGQGRVVRNSSTGIVTVIGNLTGSVAGSVIDNVSTGTINVTGNISSSNTTGINQLSTGIVNVTGNITCNGNFNLINNNAGIFNLTGNSTCNASVAGRCIVNTSGTVTVAGDLFIQVGGANQNHRNIENGSGTINIIGIVNGGGNTSNGLSFSIQNSSNGTINITGTVNGITNNLSNILQATILNNGGGSVNVTGTVNSSITTNTVFSAAIYNSSGTVTINGDCQSSGAGIAITNLVATTTINGNVIGGSSVVTVYNGSTGTVNLNGNAIGGTSWFAIEGVNAAGNTIIEKAIYSNLGQSPTAGFIKFKDNNPQVEILNVSNNKITLYDANQVSGLMPSIANVRLGVLYSNNTLTGTLAVPNPNNVLQGVATDNTVGTLLMTPVDFWNYLISNGFANGSIGERLKNASTVDTTGAQVAGFLV